jgi:NAD(P)H dehydrogenase (quinone)
MRSFIFFSFFWIGLQGLLLAQHVPSLVIVYSSSTGNTAQMAKAVAEGALAEGGVAVKLGSLAEISTKDLLQADAIVLGSPVYNANVDPRMQEFINTWPFEGRPFKDKVGAVFVSGGGISIGEELVMLNLIHSLLIHGLVVLGGEEPEAAFGASAITGEAPFDTGKVEELFIKKARGLGKRVAVYLKASKS